ncbi:hypothetical protein [Neorhodopirellula pilleata]|uniref:hypothetical protein n=1 Tax=Neorhodopirellula pilleata TaxID=2714738 RepID=UPI0011B7B608|nr:hypothetical protein [Neorhodopirellula pilleata]
MSFDWRALVWGYFESDDFNLLIDNRSLPLPDLIYAVMNDHIYPIGRLIIRGLHWMFGTNAIFYNCISVGSLVALVWSGCLYLRSSGVSRLGTSVFLLLLVSWTMWGELTSGEYILLFHESFMTAALLVGWATIRWRETSQLRYSIFTAMLVGYSCFMNISGFWVACAALVFLACEAWGHCRRSRGLDAEAVSLRWLSQFAAIVIPILLAIVFYNDAYHRPGGPTFLSSAGERHGLGGLVLQWTYTICTALLSILIAIPHHLIDFGAMEISMAFSLLCIAGASAYAWPELVKRSLHSRFVAILLIVSGVTLMVCLGRPTVGLGNVVPPKYLFMPVTLFCLVFAFLFDGWWYRLPERGRPLFQKLCLIGVALVWSSQGGASICGHFGVPFFETTRGGEIREHRREYAAMQQIKETLFVPLEQAVRGNLAIPEIPGSTLGTRYPELAFPWQYQPAMSYMLDVLADDPSRFEVLFPQQQSYPPVTVTRTLRDDVSPEFLKLLQTSEPARQLYGLPTTLQPIVANVMPDSSTPQVTISIDKVPSGFKLGVGEVIVDDHTGIRIEYPEWAPEERCYLAIRWPSTESVNHRNVTVSVDSELFGETTGHLLETRFEVGELEIYDLLTIPSFALNETIESVTLHFRKLPAAIPSVRVLRCDSVRREIHR